MSLTIFHTSLEQYYESIESERYRKKQTQVHRQEKAGYNDKYKCYYYRHDLNHSILGG